MADARTFLITGGSSGIGAETARRAAREGYNVVLAARSSDRLDALVEEIGAESALAVTCDVTDEAAQRSMVDAALERFGSIDVVLANAGRGIADNDPADWRGLIETNVFGAILTAKLTVDALKASGGHLLILGSAAGRRAIPGSVYGATKWAMTGFGYNMREELKGSGVRVTLIEPGVVDTPFFDDPKPHGLKAEDVAGAILYAAGQPARVNVNEIWLTPSDG